MLYEIAPLARDSRAAKRVPVEREAMGENKHLKIRTHKFKDRGFSLLEMMIVLAIILVLAKITVPRFINIVGDINLRHVANNYSGLLQSARIQAVKSNTPYTVNITSLSTGGSAFFIHARGGSYTTGDPMLPLGSQITYHLGTGSGATNESTLTCGSGCTFGSSPNYTSFNARGLPCSAPSGACAQNNAVGYLTLFSNTTITGNTSWAAVIVTAGGRIQIWTSDGAGNWVQRN
jgi:prepilin-type N-terminal cleavage/methylation domain-containing protein